MVSDPVPSNKKERKKNVVKVGPPLTKLSGSAYDLEALIWFIITLSGYDNCCHRKKYNVNQSRTLIFQLLTFCADYLLCIFILLPFAESFKKGCCQLQGKVCARSTG